MLQKPRRLLFVDYQQAHSQSVILSVLLFKENTYNKTGLCLLKLKVP